MNSPRTQWRRLARWFSRSARWFKRHLSSGQSLLIFLLGLLAVTFVMVMFSDIVLRYMSDRLGLSSSSNSSSKSEVLKFIGIGMGGVLIALQALMSYKRAKAMEDTAKAQADAVKTQADAVLNTEQGLRQERLKNAIEHLGHEKDSVRLGGAYELFHLAEDIEELRQTVFDILCAHIRQTTGESAYRKTHGAKPSEEVQSLLTLLFVQEHDVFKGCPINLQGSWLNGVDLTEARLEKAVLTEAHLQEADLRRANLQEAELLESHLQDANLGRANLRVAHLEKACLQGADLQNVHLYGADLLEACLQGANLYQTRLQGANLGGAQLQGANLGGAQLQGAFLVGAQLQGVRGIYQAQAGGTFEERIRGSIGEETDLLGVFFEGKLSSKQVDSIVEGLPDGRAKELREKLKSHIGKPPSNQLPENSGAITGAYTKEEAEKWIAEYDKATSEVPTSNTDTGDGQ